MLLLILLYLWFEIVFFTIYYILFQITAALDDFFLKSAAREQFSLRKLARELQKAADP